MSSLPKREIADLVALHHLEPMVREIFVEGPTDKHVIQWYLGEHEISDVPVLEVETVSIPVSEILRLGLEDNNRGRVITLAHLLEPQLADKWVVTCIADRDFDQLFGVEYTCGLLLLTDYASMELYLFDAGILNKFLRLVVRGFPKAGEKVIDEIRNPLKTLFMIRAANQKLKLGFGQVSFDKSCKLIDESGVVLDIEKHLRTFTRCDKEGQTRIATEISELGKSEVPEIRHAIHGHDMIDLLTWYIRQHKGFRKITYEIVDRAMFACLEKTSLDGENMFQVLLSRMAGDNRRAPVNTECN